jgi:hypothetical protein
MFQKQQSDVYQEYFKKNPDQFFREMQGLAKIPANEYGQEKLQKMWEAVVKVIFADRESFKTHWPKLCAQAAGNAGLEDAVIYLRATIAKQTASVAWEAGGITLAGYQATLKKNMDEDRIDWKGLSEITPHVEEQLWAPSANVLTAVKSGLMNYFRRASDIEKLNQTTKRAQPTLDDSAPTQSQ